MAEFSVSDILAEINKQAPNFGVSPTIATALFMAENSPDGVAVSGNGDAISSKKAQGIFQVMPATARGLQKAGFLPSTWKFDPNDLPSQVSAGLAAVKDLSTRAQNPNDPYEIAAGFNGSPAVQSAYLKGKPIPAETSQYLTKVQTALQNQGVATGAPKMPDLTPSSSTPVTGAPTAAPSTPTTTRVTTSIVDPATMDRYTNDILGATQPGGTYDDAIATVQNANDQRVQSAADMTSAIKDRAAADAESAGLSSLKDSTAAARLVNILTQLNINPDIANNEMLKAAGVVNQTNAQMIPLKADIDQRMSVGMFDNPLEWLVNQVRLPGMVSQYNGLVSTQNAATDTFKTLADVAKKEQDITKGMDADIIQREGLAKQKALLAGAQEATAKVSDALAGAQIRDSAQVAILTGAKLQMEHNYIQVIKDRMTETEGNTAKAAQEQADIADLGKINAALKMAGAQPIDSLKTFRGMSKEERDQLINVATTGKFGKEFPTSFSLVYNRGNLDNISIGADAATKIWVSGTAQAARKATDEAVLKSQQPGYVGPKIDRDKQMALELAHRQAVYQAQANTDMAAIGVDQNNPFKLNYTTVSKLPTLSNNPVAQFVQQHGPQSMDPLMTDSGQEQVIMQKFAGDVAAGRINIYAATDAVNDFYKKATFEQGMRTKWGLFGLEKPDNTYKVSIGAPTGFIGTSQQQTIDLGNPAQVENFLTRTVAKMAATRELGETLKAIGTIPVQ